MSSLQKGKIYESYKKILLNKQINSQAHSHFYSKNHSVEPDLLLGKNHSLIFDHVPMTRCSDLKLESF